MWQNVDHTRKLKSFGENPSEPERHLGFLFQAAHFLHRKNMKLHLSLIRNLPAHQRLGMLLPVHEAVALMPCVDAKKDPARGDAGRSEGKQYWFGSMALAGSGNM